MINPTDKDIGRKVVWYAGDPDPNKCLEVVFGTLDKFGVWGKDEFQAYIRLSATSVVSPLARYCDWADDL